MRGEVEFAIGYSEPQAGSDAASLQLKAEHDDERGGWLLNGHKIWTTSAHFADWYWVGARTGPHKHKGITLFLVPMDHPGLEVHPTMTIGDERTNEVFFTDVFVPDDHVVGNVNQGWTYICEALDLERFAMLPVGPHEMKVQALCDWVRDETRDGEPLREQTAARRAVARMLTGLEVARLLQRRVISEALRDRIPTVESAMYKLYQSEFGQRVANTALDLMGPAGQLKPEQDFAPINGRFERSYRYTVVDTIGGGASEIQKNIIAVRGLGLPKNF
jgi:alkylation response protein AidB-like acyl-CoA dehydrogenase